MLDKSEIRRRFLQQRRAMAPGDAAARSAAIRDRTLALPEVREARDLLVYVSSKDNEVDTKSLISALLYRRRTVLVPVSESGGVMAWSRLEDLNELVPGRFGLFEPLEQYRRMTPPPDGAVALVPGIAFTRDGYRIGYGGGYYDRFLADFRGRSFGLAYDHQLVEAFPIEAYDVPLSAVVTESAVYRRGAEA